MAIGQAIAQAVGGIAGAVGGYFSDKANRQEARRQDKLNWQRQQEVLKNQVQWRVADTIAAGLHPLAALGVNPADAPAGVAVGGSGWQSQLGADLGRAVESAVSTEDKTAVQMAQLGLERTRLENELVKTQIASQRMRNIQQATPGVPTRLGDAVNGSIAIPGTKSRIPQEHPMLSQDANDAYGEVLGELFGMGNFAVDAYRYLGLESILTRDDVTPALRHVGRAVSGDISKGGFRSRHLGGR